jgi:cathepsin L
MDLSEQQILDCTPNPQKCGGTGGCGGGTAELAMAQIIAMGKLNNENIV